METADLDFKARKTSKFGSDLADFFLKRSGGSSSFSVGQNQGIATSVGTWDEFCRQQSHFVILGLWTANARIGVLFSATKSLLAKANKELLVCPLAFKESCRNAPASLTD